MHSLKILPISLLLASISIAGCGDDPQQAAVVENIDLTHLTQSWIHSYEEDTRESTTAREVYRPKGSKEFPPSWFRMRYIFHEDGTCDWLVLHHADAHYMTQGTWEFDPQDGRVVLIYDAVGTLRSNITFRILELDEDLLRVEPWPKPGR